MYLQIPFKNNKSTFQHAFLALHTHIYPCPACQHPLTSVKNYVIFGPLFVPNGQSLAPAFIFFLLAHANKPEKAIT
jgi:hypothetical protein